MTAHTISQGGSRGSLILACAILLAVPAPGSAQDPTLGEPPVRGTESTLDGDSVAAPELPSAVAQFTTAVEDREPIDQVTFVSNDIRTITFFSDLRGLKGQTVTHRWIYGGQTMAEVPFEVRGPRWRVWSSKDLVAEWTGDWTVEIVTGSGEVIAAETFTYSAPGA
jgi:hypothetical protein